jgi:hypothetical protein
MLEVRPVQFWDRPLLREKMLHDLCEADREEVELTRGSYDFRDYVDLQINSKGLHLAHLRGELIFIYGLHPVGEKESRVGSLFFKPSERCKVEVYKTCKSIINRLRKFGLTLFNEIPAHFKTRKRWVESMGAEFTGESVYFSNVEFLRFKFNPI